MTVELNHTIIPAKDKRAAAKFLAGILGLAVDDEWGHFIPVRTGNGVTLDYAESKDFPPHHYAFLLSEAEFDAAFARLLATGNTYWADPFGQKPGAINRHYGGRGVYFRDPSGHLMEMITRPYGDKPVM